MARAQVRNTLQESLIMARRDGHRVLILGDFNATPPKGRWGYATGSATVREDGTMENWVHDTNLTDVFQGGKSRPTWKPSEGPQPATLDRVFVSLLDLLPITMSVKWHKSLIVFDHAMLLLRVCLSRLDAARRNNNYSSSRLFQHAQMAPTER
jgi:endonuclease/exonuclease/phosphatase family metal-dependent hydrolase